MTEAWADPAFTRLFLSWAAARAEALRDPAVDREDLEQEARIALWQACRTYDPALSSLKTWCWRHVEFAVANFLRVQYRRRRALQAELDAPVDLEGQRMLGDTVPSLRYRVEEAEEIEFAWWLMQKLDLTPLESTALRVYLTRRDVPGSRESDRDTVEVSRQRLAACEEKGRQVFAGRGVELILDTLAFAEAILRLHKHGVRLALLEAEVLVNWSCFRSASCPVRRCAAVVRRSSCNRARQDAGSDAGDL